MARSIDEYQSRTEGVSIADYADRGTTRSTARAFAAAISALAISALVITTTSEALNDEGTYADNEIAAGAITLDDDDRGRSLFDVADLGPNQVQVECIRIIYTGSILPVDLTMGAVVGGTGLAPHLAIEIDEGSNGAFEDCTGFELREPVFEGTVQELGDGDLLELHRFRNLGDEVTYRFTVEMADVEEAVDKTASINFTWEAATAS
jgi:hypothetical protein